VPLDNFAKLSRTQGQSINHSRTLPFVTISFI